jgi:endonuclease/exonuclease/phosphatase family metal-dependent hydrolase
MSPIPVGLRLAGLALAVGGCAAHNYSDPLGPRFAGGRPAPSNSDTLRIVSFNVEYGREIDRAIDLFRREPELRGTDVILLQEMTARSTAKIASGLGLAWVYYPATRHPATGQDFGNAILSRWPIEADRKIILPYRSRVGRTQRAAVAATIRVRDDRIRVYSLHLATWMGNGPKSRRHQLEAVLADADSFPRAIIGGDFNSETVPDVAARRGYAWPTRKLPPTASMWTLDHLLFRGLEVAGSEGTGVVADSRGASDHRAVWARVVLDRPPQNTSN